MAANFKVTNGKSQHAILKPSAVFRNAGSSANVQHGAQASHNPFDAASYPDQHRTPEAAGPGSRGWPRRLLVRAALIPRVARMFA